MTDAGGTDHADVFDSLSNPTRVDILEALWEAENHQASFSELRKTLDMRDSGKFNYHLGKLSDHFITKTDGGEYRLRFAGIHVVGALIAGTYTGEGPVEDVPFGDPCPVCGGETAFQYDGERFAIECLDCSAPTLSQGPAPPSVFADADPDTIPVELYIWIGIARVDV